MAGHIDLKTIVNDPELLNMVSEGKPEMAEFLKFCSAKGIETLYCCTGHYYNHEGYLSFANLDKKVVERIYKGIDNPYNKTPNASYLKIPEDYNFTIHGKYQNFSKALDVLKDLIEDKEVTDDRIRDNISRAGVSLKPKNKPENKRKNEIVNDFIDKCEQKGIKLSGLEFEEEDNTIRFRDAENPAVLNIINQYLKSKGSSISFSSELHSFSPNPSVFLSWKEKDFDRMMDSFNKGIESTEIGSIEQMPEYIQDMYNISRMSKKMDLDMHARSEKIGPIQMVQVWYHNLYGQDRRIAQQISNLVKPNEKNIIHYDPKRIFYGIGTKNLFSGLGKLVNNLHDIAPKQYATDNPSQTAKIGEGIDKDNSAFCQGRSSSLQPLSSQNTVKKSFARNSAASLEKDNDFYK